MATKKQPASKKEDVLDTLVKQNQAILEALGSIATALTNKPVASTIQETPEVEVAPKKRGRPAKPKPTQVAPKETRTTTNTVRINPLNGKPFLDFQSFEESKQERKDIKVDSKLWDNRQPSTRRGRSIRIKMNCSSCNRQCNVLPEETSPDSNYKCNQCITKGRG